MPAAICVLKPCPGDARKRMANPPMAGLPSRIDERSWPTAADTKDLPEKPRQLRKLRMNSPEQKLVGEEDLHEKVGDNQKVVQGLAGQWRALDRARLS